MLTTAYTLESGIELPAAYIVLRSSTVNSYTLTNDDTSTSSEVQVLDCTYDIYQSEDAYNVGKPAVDSINKVFTFNPSKLLSDQVYSVFS